MKGITMDGTWYRVRVVYNSMERSFSFQSGINEGYMLSGYHERDLIGTSYPYQMGIEPDPAHPADYDAFFQAVSAPVPSHSITLPYGQGTITFDAEIQDGRDVYGGKIGNIQRWHGLKVSFIPIKPQRRPD